MQDHTQAGPGLKLPWNWPQDALPTPPTPPTPQSHGFSPLQLPDQPSPRQLGNRC